MFVRQVAGKSSAMKNVKKTRGGSPDIRSLLPDRYRAGIIREAKNRFVHLEDSLKHNELKNLFIYCGHLYSKGKLEKATPVLSLLQQLIPSEKQVPGASL